ncbi:MAG: four helix bundle protein [Candidatus Peribacteraceae bacterium]|nr:four helix bundle protein [Candidatus Peribacteraceae bacterium]
MAFRFRQFKVYKDAKLFRKSVHDLLRKFPSSEKYKLTDQIERACNSILLNIAEGCSRRSDMDFARFLETSSGSVNEVVAGFDAALDDGIINEEDFDVIEKKAKNIVNQLGGFARSLRRKPKDNVVSCKL